MRPVYQRGQVYPLFAMLLVVLLGFSAMSIDVGYYRYQQRTQQIATDAAAIAGAQEYVRSGNSSTSMADAVWADAKTNGFATPAATITADPGYSSSFTTGHTAIEVKITQSYPKFFGAIYGSGNQAITTRAVAALVSTAPGCIVTLDPGSTSSIHSLIGEQCGVITAGCPKVTGTIDVGTFTYSTTPCSNVTGGSATFSDAQPQLSGQPPDPCGTIPDCKNMSTFTPPPAASCTGTNATFTATLTPAGGCYNNVGKIAGCNGKGSASTFTLSGFYVFEGSGVDFNGCSVQSGTGTSGVTIYLDTGATFNVGGSVLTLSAPSSGDFVRYGSGQAGILFYGPDAANSVTTANGTTITSTGIWYFPNSSITLNGANGSTFTGGVIVKQYTDNGNTRFLDPSTSASGGTASIPYIVE